MTLQPPPADAPLAAIDIGSNSFRLEVGQMLGPQYRRLDYLKDTVRLGAGLDAEGMLTDEAAERGLGCLRRFSTRLDGIAPERVRAVATQTLREAKNRDAFLVEAQAALGHPIEVISGREEARLIYAGVAQLQPSRQPRLVIDIGGRSTEMILGRGRTPIVAESFAVGSVSLSMRYFADGRLSAEAFRAAQVAAGAELEEALEPFAARHWREALGSSGTAGAVSQLLATNGITGGEITPAALRWCMERCIAAGHVDKLDFAGLRDDRRPVIAGGLAILYTLGAHFGIQALQPARGALRQGVIVDLHERIGASRRHRAQALDMRDASVRALQQRFMVDKLQAKRVRALALALHAGAMPDAGNETVRELGWAADLHELGMMVSHHDHHRHSAYLLAHADAPGFSQSQQRRLAELALGQRGGLRKVADSLAGEAFAWQLLALRLAALACHARGPMSPRALQLERRAGVARLRYDRAWGEAHPRAVYLLHEEAQAWSRSGVLELQLPA
jgi:exopolyphosphatase/guanosine-5'-triphosphate,3'-diphosphate pyrophosphatase